MLKSIRRLSLAASISLVALASFAVPAQATEITGDCIFSGKAKAQVELVGGTGTYSFTEFLTACAVEGKGKSQTGTATLDITSNGTFTNTICGTGTAKDADPTITATVTSTDAEAAASLKAKLDAADWGYTIEFVAFEGDLFWKTGTGGGAVHLDPDESAGKPAQGNDCAGGFKVTGDFAFRK